MGQAENKSDKGFSQNNFTDQVTPAKCVGEAHFMYSFDLSSRRPRCCQRMPIMTAMLRRMDMARGYASSD
jgi:hypothetical protein